MSTNQKGSEGKSGSKKDDVFEPSSSFNRGAKTPGDTHEQQVGTGRQSHKNDGNKTSSGSTADKKRLDSADSTDDQRSGSRSDSSRRATHEPYGENARQSHRNDK